MSRFPHALALVSAALLLTGCAAGAQEPAAAGASSAASNETAPSATPSPAATTSPELETLAGLATAEEAPGFTPEAFGPLWADADGDGCDLFNEALAEYATDVQYSPRGDDTCTVLHAGFMDPYLDDIDQNVLYSSTAVGRDNVAVERYVTLADAWASGADQWDESQRVAFANDLDTMTVVSMKTSQARSEEDAAGWLPADDAAACQWAKAQVQVKTDYDLAVDARERKSLERALTDC